MAAVYDFFMQDAPYEKWRDFTFNIIDKHRLNQTQRIIDLGCGTGQITCQLAKSKDYTLTGVDLAADMLSEAALRAQHENVDIQWINQDLRHLEGLDNYDLAISYCDVINYLTEESDLSTVFKNVHHLLVNDGLFVFDIHSLHHVEQNMKGEMFSEVYDDLAYIWFCEAGDKVGEVYHDLTFFVESDQNYERFDERHHQRTFELSFYKEILRKTGFTILGVYADFETNKLVSQPSDECERLFLVCQKN